MVSNAMMADRDSIALVVAIDLTMLEHPSNGRKLSKHKQVFLSKPVQCLPGIRNDLSKSNLGHIFFHVTVKAHSGSTWQPEVRK